MGGIDGILDEDRLGLDAVYIQAKRWDGIVGRPEIQKFVGALMGKRARRMKLKQPVKSIKGEMEDACEKIQSLFFTWH